MANKFAAILKVIASLFRMMRGYHRLLALLPAEKVASLDAERMGKHRSLIRRFQFSSKDLDKMNTCISGLQDLYGGVKDLADCVGGFGRLFQLLNSVPHAAASFIRHWATSIFCLVYHRHRTITEQPPPAQQANTSHKLMSTLKEARAAASVWSQQRDLIDVPDSVGSDLAEKIWLSFLDQGAGGVIENAPVLAAKIGKQKILSEKIKAARVRLEAKQEAMKVFEAPMNALKKDVHACNEQLQELRRARATGMKPWKISQLTQDQWQCDISVFQDQWQCDISVFFLANRTCCLTKVSYRV